MSDEIGWCFNKLYNNWTNQQFRLMVDILMDERDDIWLSCIWSVGVGMLGPNNTLCELRKV